MVLRVDPAGVPILSQPGGRELPARRNSGNGVSGVPILSQPGGRELRLAYQTLAGKASEGLSARTLVCLSNDSKSTWVEMAENLMEKATRIS